MMNESTDKVKTFRYNMSIYYQSTIIYFVAFVIYVIVRGEFVEGSVTLILNDPIIYFFAFIVLISIISLLFNLYKNKKLDISEDSLAFVNRFRTKKYLFRDIVDVKITTGKSQRRSRALRLIRIKLKNRRRPIILRPYDYENEESLIQTIKEFKLKLEAHV